MGTATLGPRARCATLLRLLELGVDRVEVVGADGRLHGHVDPTLVREIPADLLASPLLIVADLCERRR